MITFLLGAIAGGVAATYWQPDLSRMRTERMPQLRQRLADRVESAERTIVQQVGNASTKACGLLRGRSPDKDEPLKSGSGGVTQLR